jgi:hypothetical protein
VHSLHARHKQTRGLQGVCRGRTRRDRRYGGKILGYFFPTDFAGPTNEACGLIDFLSLASYEQHRHALAEDLDHEKNAAELERSGVIVVMNRSII